MKFCDRPKLPVFLDTISHRIEKTKDGEVKMTDLTLRVQPFQADDATAINHEMRALLWTLNSAEQRKVIASIGFNLKPERQQIEVYVLPEMDDPNLALVDVDISGVRVACEKDVDGYKLVFYASFGPAGARELEYVQEWLGHQRFLSFFPMNENLFDGKGEPAAVGAEA